jgi:hypothetical protein
VLINNPAGARLLSPITISRQIQLINGSLQTGKHDVILLEQSIIQGNNNSFIKTEAGGTVIKRINGLLANFLVPCRI